MSRLSRCMLTDAEIIAREHARRATIDELQKRLAEMEAERSVQNTRLVSWMEDYERASKERDEALADNEQLVEQLRIRSASGMAKDMQEIMRINNEMNAALTSERRRREECEAALRLWMRDEVQDVRAEKRYASEADRSGE